MGHSNVISTRGAQTQRSFFLDIRLQILTVKLQHFTYFSNTHLELGTLTFIDYKTITKTIRKRQKKQDCIGIVQ